MADITLYGHIVGIRYKETCVNVTLVERKLGYKKKDGTKVKDELLTFVVTFKPYFKKYISSFFSTNMLVKVKGFLLPYIKTNENEVSSDGFTIIGQTIDIAPYPSTNMVQERKLIKESQSDVIEAPDLANYNQPDF